ncbi:MAG: hypothetical protein LHV69_04380 [Elusimicrobia bacterium]|nr:hypothetical protein [Candidatus Obscuribacterium magneticum]
MFAVRLRGYTPRGGAEKYEEEMRGGNMGRGQLGINTTRRLMVIVAILTSVVLGVGVGGCKKSSDDSTSSGGGVPPPSPNPVPNPNPVAPQLTLFVTKIGAGNGAVTSVPGGIDCGTDCDQPYDEGTVVTLTAVPAADSIFAEWTGACAGGGDCRITMAAPQSVAARFEKRAPVVTVTKSGNGDGTVLSSPAGINCGTDCEDTYTLNTVITLTANPDIPGSRFAGWSGACSGTDPCVLTLDGGKSVEARFNKSTPEMTILKIGDGEGTVSSDPPGIVCGGDCTELFDYNTAVVLRATPPDGFSEFAGWSGDCSGWDSCTVTMDMARMITATFQRVRKTLSVTNSGSGTGTVASSPSGISCGADCLESYLLDTAVTLTAVPDSTSSEFDHWAGACSGSGGCTVILSQPRSVEAVFRKSKRTLTVSKTGDGDGQVTSSPSGILCGLDCTKDYNHGTYVTLTSAALDRFSEFVGWGGACTGNTDCLVTLTEARNVSAEFQKARKTLTTTISGPGSRGIVTSVPPGINCGLDCTENYLLDTIVSLTPTPADAGSEFDHWAGACSGSADCSVTLSDNQSVEAVFRISRKTLSVSKAGNGTGTVTSSPAGIDCGSDCSETYDYNTVVALTQTQGTGYFTGWSGACSGDKSCTVTMTDNRSVEASFGNVSVDGDYCQATPERIFCFFVRNNKVVQSAVGPDPSMVCYSNFYSGNTIANYVFNVDNGSTKIGGNFLSAYRVGGHFNGNCSFLSTNSFDYEATREGASSARGFSAFGGLSGSGKLTYDPNAK